MDIPENLIDLERAAEAERAKLAGLTGDDYDAQQRRWRDAAAAALAVIAKHAEENNLSRYELEMAVKKTVRHSEA